MHNIFQKAKIYSMVPVYMCVYFVPIKIIARNITFLQVMECILCTFSQNVYEPVAFL